MTAGAHSAGASAFNNSGANRDLPLGRDCLTGFLLLHHCVTPLEIRVANVCAEVNAAGNAVDGAGKNFADADRGYGIDGSAGARGILDERELTRRRRRAHRADPA
jgi:hypothetical protein